MLAFMCIMTQIEPTITIASRMIVSSIAMKVQPPSDLVFMCRK